MAASPIRRLIVSAFGAAIAAAACGSAAAGEIHGRLVLDVAGVGLADVGDVVVYLDAAGAEPPERDRAPAPATLRQKNARFAPRFLAVAKGQTVEMPNDDTIYHNVFSFSEPNDFDLGLYPASQVRSVSFEHAGVVRIYCSIHESMSGVIFVAPTPHFARVGPDGRFVLPDVPPGRWRLRTWAETLPSVAHTVRVGEGAVRVELRLAEDAASAVERARAARTPPGE